MSISHLFPDVDRTVQYKRSTQVQGE